jgi:hypothetical protein
MKIEILLEIKTKGLIYYVEEIIKQNQIARRCVDKWHKKFDKRERKITTMILYKNYNVRFCCIDDGGL